jgi:hypothetical protein
MDWIYVALDPVEDSCENSNEPMGSIKIRSFLASWTILVSEEHSPMT